MDTQHGVSGQRILVYDQNETGRVIPVIITQLQNNKHIGESTLV